MQKKFLISIAVLSAILVFSCSYAFATTNAINTVEHAAQNVANATGNVINRGVGAMGNTVNNLGVRDGNTTARTANTVGVMGTNNNNYTAARTATNNAVFGGMTANGWTWLIVGIVGLAIVGLVWYYGKQHDMYTDHTRE